VIAREKREVFPLADYGLARIGCAAAMFLAAACFAGLYDRIRARSRILLIQQVCLAMGAAPSA